MGRGAFHIGQGISLLIALVLLFVPGFGGTATMIAAIIIFINALLEIISGAM